MTMASWPLLSLITFLPLLGALLILLLVRGDDDKAKKTSSQIALGTSLGTFAVSLLIFRYFDPADPGFQLVEKYVWIPSFNIMYQKGIDGISIWFVLISTFLTPICVLSAWGGVSKRVKEFMIALLVLETMMVGMFTALDFVLFYLFFEGVLIPMYLIIGVWGGAGRIYAAYKFFLYTFLGSVLMLVAIFWMVIHIGTTDMTAMMGGKFPKEAALLLWLAFFASFAVKTPMWPFHTWLPFAHVEAPTAGSVILAAVLLKMGGYGFIRIAIQMLPTASTAFAPLVFRPQPCGDRLHIAGRTGAERYEKTDRLFIRRAYGFCHARPFQHESARDRRCYDRDDQPRFCFGRLIPLRRRSV